MKKLLTIAIATIGLCFLALGVSLAAEIDLTWDANPEPDIAGYRVYQSIDMGQSWAMVADVSATTAMLSSVPDSGLILFRISAYDTQDESIRHNAGAWFNNDWIPISSPKRSGIK